MGNQMKPFRSAVLIALLFSAAPALAFDDQRAGFILHLGAGFHTLHSNITNNGYNLDSKSETGLATSFKIGGGITDRILIYYVRNASWFSAPYGNTGRTATYSIGLSGVGVSIFMAPSAPSGYFLAAVGAGDISTPFEDATPDTGSAIMFGGGYEFRKNLMLEGTLLATSIPSGYVTLKSSSLQFTINYLFY
jgi:hypothetical protein